MSSTTSSSSYPEIIHVSKDMSLQEKVEPKLRKLIDLINKPITFVGDQSRHSWHNYKLYVQRNKQWLRTIEQSLYYLSFFVPGRFGDAAEIGELIFSLSGIMGTINDRALNEERELTVYLAKETSFVKNIKTLIQIIQHLQLFFELMAIKRLNTKQKWKLILWIEIIKMFLRLYLLFYFNGHMLIIPNENEKSHQSTLQLAQEQGKYKNLQTMYANHGRGSHPHGHFSPDSKILQNTGHTQLKRHITSRYARFRTIFAELLHIMRPVIYVLSLIKTGMNSTRSWKPFIFALLTDIYSQMLYLSGPLTDRQRIELKRRRMIWIYYLLKPPFFDKFISDNLNSANESLKQKNSRIRYWILLTFTQLLCQYQGNYFNIEGSPY